MFEDFRLKVFNAVVDKCSFTLAAKELGVSQPAVSQNISELEKEFGISFFVRKRGAVTLTPEGRIFYEYVRRILFWYNSAVSVFSTETISSRKSLRISCDHVSRAISLPIILTKVYSVNPLIEVTIVPEDSSEYDIRLGRDLAIEPSDAFAEDPLFAILKEALDNRL